MNQGTILGSQIGRWIILAALVVVLGALLLTIRPVGAQSADPQAITPPPAPTALMSEAVGTQTVELDWTAPPGVAVTGYRIERSTETPVKWVVVSANTGNKNAYYTDNSSSLAGKSVRYRVAAFNSVGMGLYFTQEATAAVTLPKAGTQPGAPTGLKATVSPTTAGTISLSWSTPSQGSGAITGYHVQWSKNRDRGWQDGADSGDGAVNTGFVQHAGTPGSTTLDNPTIGAGVTLYYRVAAENDQTDPIPDRGPYSAVVSATTRAAGVPSVPQTLAATAVGLQTVELTWDAPATPGGTITGYRIERKTNTDTEWVVVSANTGNKNEYYSDNSSSLAGKSDVVYRVAAFNSVGMGVYTADSTPAVILPKAGTQPDAPTGLTVTPTAFTSVTLTWTAPSGTVTGYTVQWSPTRELGATAWANITDQPADGTDNEATDTIPAGTTRYYRVAALNTGVTPNMGPYSAVATVGPADQMGVVSLSTQEPMVGTAIIANLTDDDGMVSNQAWQWQSSDAMGGPFSPISGATSASYTPAKTDVGKYLRARVEYNDANRSGLVAYSKATESAVALPENRDGNVSLSPQEPLVGEAVTATLTDADGMSNEVWEWHKSMDKTDWMDAAGTGAATAMYTPETADVGYYLRAMVTYDDKYREGQEATSDPTTSMVVANNQPTFADGMGAREVAENSEAGAAVGAPVMATDADADDTLTYALSGDDMDSFAIDTSTGQIMVGEGTMLDYEAEKMTYMVTVTATDDSEAPNSSGSIDVTISVTNVNEAPYFADETATLEVAENTAADMAIGDAFGEAMDPDAGDTLTYSLGGDDMDSFGFDAETRQIMTMAALDYETKDSYSVMVIATDSGGLTDSIDVTINVTDVDEGPVVRYDDNGDGQIQIGEMFNAIDDYFEGQIGIADMFEVIDAYFENNG